jgi:hypothetical protein
VALNLDAWDTAPRRVAVNGRRVRVGWFRHVDPDTIGVTRAGQDGVALLVIPPQATTAAAGIVLATAVDGVNSAGPADILVAAGIGGQDPAPMPRSNSRSDAHLNLPSSRTRAGCSSGSGVSIPGPGALTVRRSSAPEQRRADRSP